MSQKAKIITCKKYLFMLLFGCLLSAGTLAKDVYKIAANSHYISGYWEELLSVALNVTADEFGPYEIVIHQHGMGNGRHLQEMLKGELINARIGITTPQRETAYIPIRIPIRKGLLNYRLLVANKSDLHKFEHVKTLQQLMKLKAGLVDRWVTSDVFEHHDFNLIRIRDYDGLFRMLLAKRYDYTVRGVNEVYGELEFKQPTGADFVVVPNIGLYITSPTYLFISKRHPNLAARVEKGFENMIKSGQFDNVFYKWNQASIDKANIKGRTFFKVENPFLSQDTVPLRPELWIHSEIGIPSAN